MPSRRGQKQQKNKSAFEEAARALDCDEDPAHFDAALKKVARHKPAKENDASLKGQCSEKTEKS